MNRPASGTYYEFVFDIYNRRVSTWGVGATSPTQALIYSDSSLLAFRSASGTNFEHYNWVGTKRVITDYTGAVQETVASLPFGDGYSYTGADGDWSDFAGMDGDTESNTEHAQFRQYEQDQGRWFSPDPYYGSYDFTNPQSFDRYAYALNNPVSFIDPSGLDSQCVASEGGFTCTVTEDGCESGCYDQYGNYYTPTNTGIAGDSTTAYAGDAWDDPGGYVPMSNGLGGYYITGSVNLPPIDNPSVSDDGPQYTRRAVCGASTLLNTGGATLLDAIGIIPGFNDVSAGVNTAKAIIQAGAVSTSVGTAVFGDSTPTDAVLSGGGLGITLADTMKVVGGAAGEWVPVLGNLLSLGATLRDIAKMNDYDNDCMAGTN